jgi:hypothetical protein
VSQQSWKGLPSRKMNDFDAPTGFPWPQEGAIGAKEIPFGAF